MQPKNRAFDNSGTLAAGQRAKPQLANGSGYAIKITPRNPHDISAAQTSTIKKLSVANSKGTSSSRGRRSTTFSALAADPSNDILAYDWTFSKGTEGQIVVHRFIQKDSYIVTLTVTDDDCVSMADAGGTQPTDIVPKIVELTGSSATEAGKLVTLSAVPTQAGDGAVTYLWDFGDNQPVYGESASHLFAEDGFYTATLTVSAADGGSVTQTIAITIENIAPEVTPLAVAAPKAIPKVIKVERKSKDKSKVAPIKTATSERAAAPESAVGPKSNSITARALEIAHSSAAPTVVEATAPIEISEGECITLNAIATHPDNAALTYSWDFGDGSNLIWGETVTHRYAADGLYTMTVLVRDNDGAVDIEKRTVVVNNVAPVITDFSAPTAAKEGEGVLFSALATHVGNDGLTYVWQFGDGTAPVTGQSVVHTFTGAGTCHVSLTVTDTSGAIAVQTHEITVSGLAPVVMVGKALKAVAGQAVQFRGSYQDPSGSDKYTVIWAFGDGHGAEGDLFPIHTFSNQGHYTVTMSVIDSRGQVTAGAVAVTVLKAPPKIVSLSGETTIYKGANSVFRAFAVDRSAGELTYLWDFGDGCEAEEGAESRHLYTSTGQRTVTLTVSDEAGNAATETLTINVIDVALTITSIASPSGPCEQEAATFSATATGASGSTLTYLWDFGDRTAPEIGKTVTHAYREQGHYTTTLIVTDKNGRHVTQTVEVEVHRTAPTVTLSGHPRSLMGRATPFVGSYSDFGPLNAHSAIWDFGDGTVVVGDLNSTHTYRQPGVYTVTLRVTDDNGSTAAASMTLEITHAPPVIAAQGEIIIKEINDFDGDPLHLEDDVYFYGGLNRPSTADVIEIKVPQHHDLVSDALMERMLLGRYPAVFDVSQHKQALTSASGWKQVFPEGGTCQSPAVVEIVHGGLNVPSDVSLNNVILVVKKGDIKFSGSSNRLDNVTLITNSGKVDLSGVQSTDLKVFSFKYIKMSREATFAGASLLASQKSLVFNGATCAERDRLRIISQAKIIYNAVSATRAQLLAGGDIVFRVGTTLKGGARAEGNITFDGDTTVRAVNDMIVVSPDKSLPVTERGEKIPLAIQLPVAADDGGLTIQVTGVPDAQKGGVQLADGSVVTVGQVLSPEELRSLTFVAVAVGLGEVEAFSYRVDDGWYTPAEQTIRLEGAEASRVAAFPDSLCEIWLQ